MSDNIVEVHNLVKNYKTGPETLHIIRGADFCIERGTAVSITGASGSGKSTLLNILGGLDRFDSGSCVVAGNDIGRLPERLLSTYRRKTVGLVFQFHYLLKDFTALENVMLPAYIAGQTKKQALERAHELLEEVQMGERLHHYPAKLSGGERQRVAVARALVNDPELILADEPTGNLDGVHSDIIATLLYTSAARHNKTLVVVTHDEHVAARSSLRWVLADGVIKIKS
ncbi:MAG: ABC transporter ATP-binding protein [Spirochaetaceae bacterium]|jgi:lipoprotein-releasing system ATP-binding protein|nr:ABC transporter ATP-binding protein [Spirochaetaceae bacterium]